MMDGGVNRTFHFTQICRQGNKTPPPDQSATSLSPSPADRHTGQRFSFTLTLPAHMSEGRCQVDAGGCLPSPGSGSSLSAAVSTVDGGVTMCSGAGL